MYDEYDGFDEEPDECPAGEDGFPSVGTHSGTAHPDEIGAVSILVLAIGVTPEKVIRTRNPMVYRNLDILVDVGGEYDPEAGRFDHHQWKKEPWKQERRQSGLPYASAGLIWKHYGQKAIERVIERSLGGGVVRNGKDVLTQSVRDRVFHRIDKVLIAPVDAADCGYRMKLSHNSAGSPNWVNGTDPNGVSVPWGPTTIPTISNIIAKMHPTWIDPEKGSYGSFCRGVYFFAEFLRRSIIHRLADMSSASVVEAAMEARPQRLIDHGVLLLPELVPWQDLVTDQSGVKFVVYPAPKNQNWMVRSVPTAPNAWSTKNLLPKGWMGLFGEELDAVTGDDVPDGAIFVREEGFIGSHRRKAGAIAMAIKASKMLEEAVKK